MIIINKVAMLKTSGVAKAINEEDLENLLDSCRDDRVFFFILFLLFYLLILLDYFLFS